MIMQSRTDWNNNNNNNNTLRPEYIISRARAVSAADN